MKLEEALAINAYLLPKMQRETFISASDMKVLNEARDVIERNARYAIVNYHGLIRDLEEQLTAFRASMEESPKGA